MSIAHIPYGEESARFLGDHNFTRTAPQNSAALAKRAAYVKSHFPDVVTGGKPLGSRVLLQLRMVQSKSGMIHIPEQTREFNEGQTALALVRAIGPAAFKDVATGAPWHEGAWYQVGDLVMVTRYAGRRFAIPVPGTDERVIFVDCESNLVDWRVDDDFCDLETLFDQIV